MKSATAGIAGGLSALALAGVSAFSPLASGALTDVAATQEITAYMSEKVSSATDSPISSAESSQRTPELQAELDRTKQAVRRNRAGSSSYPYASAHVTVTLPGWRPLQQGADHATVTARILTSYIWTTRASQWSPTETGEAYDELFEFERRDGAWLLSGEQLLPVSGGDQGFLPLIDTMAMYPAAR